MSGEATLDRIRVVSQDEDRADAEILQLLFADCDSHFVEWFSRRAVTSEEQQAFEELLADRQNRARARVTTAAPLAPAELGDIKKKLEAVTGKQVEIDAKVDPAVIGGARAQIGSVIYDGTIKNQLGKMREKLAK